MIARVIPAEGATELQVFRAALRAYRKEDTATVVIHKTNAHLRFPDGEETVVVVEPDHQEQEPVIEH